MCAENKSVSASELTDSIKQIKGLGKSYGKICSYLESKKDTHGEVSISDLSYNMLLENGLRKDQALNVVEYISQNYSEGEFYVDSSNGYGRWVNEDLFNEIRWSFDSLLEENELDNYIKMRENYTISREAAGKYISGKKLSKAQTQELEENGYSLGRDLDRKGRRTSVVPSPYALGISAMPTDMSELYKPIVENSKKAVEHIKKHPIRSAVVGLGLIGLAALGFCTGPDSSQLEISTTSQTIEKSGNPPNKPILPIATQTPEQKESGNPTHKENIINFPDNLVGLDAELRNFLNSENGVGHEAATEWLRNAMFMMYLMGGKSSGQLFDAVSGAKDHLENRGVIEVPF